MIALIRFDGGCKPNPGEKYGSFSVTLDDVFEIRKARFPLGHGTSNEAEFDSLQASLIELERTCLKSNIEPKLVNLYIFTDSTILRNWIRDFPRCKPERIKNVRRAAMYACSKRCFDLLILFKTYTINWNPRQKNVDNFGH